MTNAAELVVGSLFDNDRLNDRRLFYYDSDGELGELLHDGAGNFTGFAPATPADLEAVGLS